jgi:hypothetical protein
MNNLKFSDIVIQNTFATMQTSTPDQRAETFMSRLTALGIPWIGPSSLLHDLAAPFLVRLL